MKKRIRLTESDLHKIVSESVRRMLNEYYVTMKHSGHNLDDFLDDNDFLEIVNRVVKMYGPEDFDENDLGHIDDMEMEIADLINDFITDEALDVWGYKYGTPNFRKVASNVIRYIQTHLNELY